jgi:hypothetical protein
MKMSVRALDSPSEYRYGCRAGSPWLDLYSVVLAKLLCSNQSIGLAWLEHSFSAWPVRLLAPMVQANITEPGLYMV